MNNHPHNLFIYISFLFSGTTDILLQPEIYGAVITQLKLVRCLMTNPYTRFLYFFTHEECDRMKDVIDNKLLSHISGRSRLAHKEEGGCEWNVKKKLVEFKQEMEFKKERVEMKMVESEENFQLFRPTVYILFEAEIMT